jgi:hypothetical protein
MKYFILLTGIIFIYFQSCTSDKRELAQPKVTCEYSQQDLKYSGLIKTIIDNNCVPCHFAGGPANGDFTTYAGIKAKVDAGTFRQRVIVLRNMPITTSLSACDLNAIHDWLNANAPE